MIAIDRIITMARFQRGVRHHYRQQNSQPIGEVLALPVAHPRLEWRVVSVEDDHPHLEWRVIEVPE